MSWRRSRQGRARGQRREPVERRRSRRGKGDELAQSRWRDDTVDTVQGKFRASLRERTRDQVTDGNEYHD